MSKISNDDALAMLADLFASPASTKKAAPAKPKKPVVELPLPKAFAQRKTGYTTWKAIGRAVILQRQECTCCGEVTEIVRDEMFVLQNSASHSVWRRHEGYGIEAPEDLPIQVERLDEVQMVSACGACADWDFEILSAHSSRQMELPL
jgi:hypothetical protein